MINQAYFKFDQEKALASLLYVTTKLGELQNNAPSFHKVFKILYFADQKSLVGYGRPISGDYYVAMRHGPVPSTMYDMLKSARGDANFIKNDFLLEHVEVFSNHYIKAKSSPDMDALSETDLECLNDSIKENYKKDFNELQDKSHGVAWEKSDENDKMRLEDIAEEGGADREMIEYIKSNLENEKIFK